MLLATSSSSVLAALWLIALLSLAVIYVAVQFRRSEYSLEENCLYLPTFLMGRLLWRVQFMNSAPPELAAGAILVANHKSSVDPFFVQLAARRRVHWMVAKEYCVHPVFGPILRACKVIPTNRSGMDTASTKTAIRLTREGRLVGMFPEGRLNHGRELLLSVRGGAALVAARANVPMIPLLIVGSPYRRTVWSPVFMPANVRITFGKAIQPQQDTDQMILAWGKQLAELAGVPNAKIELAATRRHTALSRSLPHETSAAEPEPAG